MLIQDVGTHCNLTYDMFQRIQYLIVLLSSILVDCSYIIYLSNNDLFLSCEVLKYFKEITIEINSERSVFFLNQLY